MILSFTEKSGLKEYEKLLHSRFKKKQKQNKQKQPTYMTRTAIFKQNCILIPQWRISIWEQILCQEVTLCMLILDRRNVNSSEENTLY